ncbi:AGAP005311-PA-like protein [Anopheles sinensis]|uniref:AGAP005311-PA-like protein n=1 Tax=Anopheles sinensis TaxID=74873 RepID=A0A084W2I3_ANOSI|nr:AGAP005311-PA-like protein [Anopheles sinensis]
MMSGAVHAAERVIRAPPQSSAISKPRAVYSIDQILGNHHHTRRGGNVPTANNNNNNNSLSVNNNNHTIGR